MVLLFKPRCSLLLLELPVDLQACRPWLWRQTSSVSPTALDLAPSLVVWLGSAKASWDCLVECCIVLTLAPVTATRGAALTRSACMLNSCSANLQPIEQKMLPLLEKRPPVASLKSLVHFAQLGVAWVGAGSCKLLLLQEALRIIFGLILKFGPLMNTAVFWLMEYLWMLCRSTSKFSDLLFKDTRSVWSSIHLQLVVPVMLIALFHEQVQRMRFGVACCAEECLVSTRWRCWICNIYT